MTSKPLVNGNNTGGLTVLKTALFIVSSLAGTGLISLPKAIEHTGWIGLVVLIFILVISVYTGILTGKAWTIAASMYDDCQGHVSDPFPLLAEKTYGLPGRYLIVFVMHTTLYGSSVVCLLLSSRNIQLLVRDIGIDISFCYLLLITSACLCPFTWFGTPKDFWLIALFSVSTTVLVSAIFVISMVTNSKDTIVTHSDIDLKGFTLSFGIMMFCVGGNEMFLTFVVDMKTQSSFKWSVILAYLVTGTMYLVEGAAGYFLLGDKLDANILISLSSGTSSTIAIFLMTVHILAAYVITINPVVQHLEYYSGIPKTFTWKRCVYRLCVVASTLFVAATMPKFDAILSLIGGSTAMFLSYVCPVLIYEKICKMQADHCRTEINENELEIEGKEADIEHVPLWMRTLNHEIILVAVVAGTCATVSAIMDILSSGALSLPCYIDT